ncbi:uncharacterized protein TRUGW13939_02106 [Talaromyces rugulosus]|uniref:CCHC-type domain-containing protein n=1 Tax=Talaromyces rugulosus TaxID=121627 RepID=A0A7H8QMA5_TALRU|nr:uncharacterized protein TRUGW13939_02106 [Talaromyces rugulosus]QKX55016.1 hypothetical protein TRUGW13939_02106 [Talaromyces rugulosus]
MPRFAHLRSDFAITARNLVYTSPDALPRNCPTPNAQGAAPAPAPGPGPAAGPGAGRGGHASRGNFGGSFRGGFGGYPRAATCYKCGGPNHFARDCQAQAMKCYACGKLVSN